MNVRKDIFPVGNGTWHARVMSQWRHIHTIVGYSRIFGSRAGGHNAGGGEKKKWRWHAMTSRPINGSNWQRNFYRLDGGFWHIPEFRAGVLAVELPFTGGFRPFGCVSRGNATSSMNGKKGPCVHARQNVGFLWRQQIVKRGSGECLLMFALPMFKFVKFFNPSPCFVQLPW